MEACNHHLKEMTSDTEKGGVAPKERSAHD
jgi:hypothetical protein